MHALLCDTFASHYKSSCSSPLFLGFFLRRRIHVASAILSLFPVSDMLFPIVFSRAGFFPPRSSLWLKGVFYVDLCHVKQTSVTALLGLIIVLRNARDDEDESVRHSVVPCDFLSGWGICSFLTPVLNLSLQKEMYQIYIDRRVTLKKVKICADGIKAFLRTWPGEKMKNLVARLERLDQFWLRKVEISFAAKTTCTCLKITHSRPVLT